MRVSAVTLAYNDEGTIAGTIRCLAPFVDKHIVLISEKPYFGKESPPDRTEEICLDLGVEVIKGYWKLDNYQRNLGNILCKDSDWVLGFDSDEMITENDYINLYEFLHKTQSSAIAICPEVYWHTTDYRLTPKPSYSPIMAMKPSVRFTHIRNIGVPYELWEGGTVHHLSWCEPKDILKKVTNYAHATDFNGEIWYNTHYKNWKPEDRYAVLPDKTYLVENNPLPDELKEHLWLSGTLK